MSLQMIEFALAPEEYLVSRMASKVLLGVWQTLVQDLENSLEWRNRVSCSNYIAVHLHFSQLNSPKAQQSVAQWR